MDPDGPMGDAGASMPGEMRIARDELAAQIAALPGPRAIVGLVGAPGAGKSRLAREIVQALEARRPGAAMVVPMDGFHYDDAVLAARGLLPRKGAPETFDVAGLAHLLERLRQVEPETAIPLFDRALEISRAAAAVVTPEVRWVIVEGNYLLLTEGPWRSLHGAFDLTIRLGLSETTLRARLVRRWEKAGLAPAEVLRRVEENDLPNGRRMQAASRPADLLVSDFA